MRNCAAREVALREREHLVVAEPGTVFIKCEHTEALARLADRRREIRRWLAHLLERFGIKVVLQRLLDAATCRDEQARSQVVVDSKHVSKLCSILHGGGCVGPQRATREQGLVSLVHKHGS